MIDWLSMGIISTSLIRRVWGVGFWATEQMDVSLRENLITDEKQVSAANKGILLLWPDRTPNLLNQGAYYQ